MKAYILGAAAISATIASASNITVTLGSCGNPPSRTVFQAPNGATVPLPGDGGPFCSATIIGVTPDLGLGTAQCFLLSDINGQPFNGVSYTGGPYTGTTHLAGIHCKAQGAAMQSGGGQGSNKRGSPVFVPRPNRVVNRRQEPFTSPARPDKREAMPDHVLDQRQIAPIPVITEPPRLKDKREPDGEPEGVNKREAMPQPTFPPNAKNKRVLNEKGAYGKRRGKAL